MATLTLTGLGWAQWISIRAVDALRLFAITCELLSTNAKWASVPVWIEFFFNKM